MAKEQTRYLALLRGINVGGKNIIAKEELCRCFEELGCCCIRTYIQSGNILFRTKATSAKQLSTQIENELSRRFSYAAQAVVLSHHQYVSAVQAAPKQWGASSLRKHNAIFMLGDMPPDELLKQLPSPKKDLESVVMGPGVVFWSVSKKRLSKTTLMKLSMSPVYQNVTVRNHNTVFKLLELFDEI